MKTADKFITDWSGDKSGWFSRDETEQLMSEYADERCKPLISAIEALLRGRNGKVTPTHKEAIAALKDARG